MKTNNVTGADWMDAASALAVFNVARKDASGWIVGHTRRGALGKHTRSLWIWRTSSVN